VFIGKADQPYQNKISESNGISFFMTWKKCMSVIGGM
jgi:hypothetical protein